MIHGILFATLLATAPAAPSAALPDSVVVLEPVDITAARVHFGTSAVVLGREDLQRALRSVGIGAVRRGLPLASDIEFDGFRRADIGVVVDGERFHAACPNRMDPPTSLALPIEIEAVRREASASGAGSGLAGRVVLERARPAAAWRTRGGLTSLLGSEQDLNGSLAVEGRHHRLAGRWAQGRAYTDARDRGFGALYGFIEDDPDYTQGDVALRGEVSGVAYGVQHSATRDLPFAYLLMDERDNQLTSAYLSALGFKVYGNHARHRMDNGMRISSRTTRMSTDARQTTIGANGRVGPVTAEGFFRRWNADNAIVMGALRADNAMIPDVRQWFVNVSAGHALAGITVSGRAGWTRSAVGETYALARYRPLVPSSPRVRTFLPFSISASGVWPEREGLQPGIAFEVAAEPPTIEQQYVNVLRPGAPATRKPDWIGNPGLDMPLRITARASARHAWGVLEGHLSHVSNYVLPVAAQAGGARLVTYRGVEAAIAALDLQAAYGFAEFQGRWASGQNLEDGGPLAEMPPLEGALTLSTPSSRGAHAFARLSGAAKVRRVDVTLNEAPTPAWATLDLGARWEGPNGVTVALEVENTTNTLHTRNLSYLRDPFAAGARVWEPGRMVRMTVSFDR